jgi:hypothetical protein
MGPDMFPVAVFANAVSVSTHLHRIDTLRWTSHMDECLHELTERKECDADAVLVALIRCQMIAEKVRSSPWQDRGLSGKLAMTAEPSFYIKVLQTELDNVKRQISPDLGNNREPSFPAVHQLRQSSAF